MRRSLAIFGLLMIGFVSSSAGQTPDDAPLQLEVYTADSNAFGVTSTLIYGRTEVILVDAQFRISDARRLAERVAATGRRLKAIIVTHPHPDHYFGLATVLERFPGTPVFISAAGARGFPEAATAKITQWAPVYGAEMPSRVPTPQVLPVEPLAVDGQTIEVIADLQGDELVKSNSVVWVPSLRAVIAGDLVFQNTHVWLAESNAETRQAWLGSLRRLGALQPVVVVPGHKRSSALPNSPDALAFTSQYITDFDAANGASNNADALVAAVQRKYPTLGLPIILTIAANAAFPN